MPLTGPAADPDLTPEFPGVTDKLSIREWNPPFPFDNKRASSLATPTSTSGTTTAPTPKAYVTLAAGQKLWGSRFGKLTSIRLAAERRRRPAEEQSGVRDGPARAPQAGAGRAWSSSRSRSSR